MPVQLFLIDDMTSCYPSIQLCPSRKPFYSEHSDLMRLRIELEPLPKNNEKPCVPSLSSILFEQLSSCQYSMDNNGALKMIISFGYIYLLKYKEQSLRNTKNPETLDCLINQHFLPPLYNTFFPSTILERIEIVNDNAHCLQQIFYKSNHTIKQEVKVLLEQYTYLRLFCLLYLTFSIIVYGFDCRFYAFSISMV